MKTSISITWSIADVKQVGPDLTKKQCSEVLELAEAQHDATIGISWDVLEAHAAYLFPLKKKRRADKQMTSKP